MVNQPADIQIPLTAEERIARHQRLAEDLLARAEKPGRLDADTRLAIMAGAHASLAISYQLQQDTDVALLAQLLPDPPSFGGPEPA
jgi:hypothetical protein